mmetsp:Transcript_14126/g.20700  ORF Transcript_14126/g.20700 Transcript_14126/m.20700 type:complete len:403 (-) Transcript_14126:35-1243(-)
MMIANKFNLGTGLLALLATTTAYTLSFAEGFCPPHGFLVASAEGRRGPPFDVLTRQQLRSSTNDNLDWLKNAMGDGDDDDDGDKPPLMEIVAKEEYPEGLAGFSVDKELGFCAFLTTKNQYFAPVVVAPSDTQAIEAPESLLMVQLAGGMDLGTALLPPDTLARLVADELSANRDDDDDDDEREELSIGYLRPRLKLQKVLVVPNLDFSENDTPSRPSSSVGNDGETDGSATTSEDRKSAIDDQAPKVFTAVQRLPGLAKVTVDQVTRSLQRHADPTGKVDREAFSLVLDTLRREVSNTLTRKPDKVKFQLLVEDVLVESQTVIIVPVVNTVEALGLSMRYNVPIEISPVCIKRMSPVDTLKTRFPLFRPIRELQEDARVMDGFIPSMYARAKGAPKNDDKV